VDAPIECHEQCHCELRNRRRRVRWDTRHTKAIDQERDSNRNWQMPVGTKRNARGSRPYRLNKFEKGGTISKFSAIDGGKIVT